MAAQPELSSSAVVLPHLDAADNLARWIMGGAEDAEDVVQEAMVRALTCFPSFRGRNARAWLSQIVRNNARLSEPAPGWFRGVVKSETP